MENTNARITAVVVVDDEAVKTASDILKITLHPQNVSEPLLALSVHAILGKLHYDAGLTASRPVRGLPETLKCPFPEHLEEAINFDLFALDVARRLYRLFDSAKDPLRRTEMEEPGKLSREAAIRYVQQLLLQKEGA